ncbi:WD40 repeat domain-containing protein [Streptomyces sp. NPDC054863]
MSSVSVCAVAFSPDGGFLLAADTHGDIRRWDLVGHELTGVRLQESSTVLFRNLRSVTALAIAPCGTWCAVGDEDGLVRLWSLPDGRSRAVLTGHTHAVVDVDVVAPDGRWIATAGEDATVRVWDRRGGRVVAAQRTEGPLRSCSWRPDAQGLAVGGDRSLYVCHFRPAT